MIHRDWRGVVYDALLVVLFVVLGRLQHGAADAFQPLGFATTLWPFLAGLALGQPVAAVLNGDYRALPSGVAVVATTVVGGLCLRYASGQGIAVSFAIVTTIVLATLMVGWRFAHRMLT